MRNKENKKKLSFENFYYVIIINNTLKLGYNEQLVTGHICVRYNRVDLCTKMTNLT